MSLDPRFSTSLEDLHPRGLIPNADACSVAGCEHPPVAGEPKARNGKTGVYWYCVDRLDLAPAGVAYPVGRMCGAPAERYANTPCGGLLAIR